MGSIFRVYGALILGVALVGGAYFLRGNETGGEENVIAVIDDSPLRTYVGAQDSDGDGISDWEEELLKRGPYSSLNRRVTSPEEDVAFEEPETLTDQFAIQFFEDMVRARGESGAPLDAADQEALIASAVDTFVGSARDRLFTRADISLTFDDSLEAIRQYGNNAGAVLTENSAPDTSEHEAVIFQRAFANNDPEELKKLAPIEEAYRKMVEGLRVLPAPAVLATEHLSLLNTLNAVHADVVAMQGAFTDPLYTLARVKRYWEDGEGLYYAIEEVRRSLEDRNIVYEDGEPGVLFFSLRP